MPVSWRRIPIRVLRHLGYAAGYGALGTLATLLGVYVHLLESRPDLEVWHRAGLDEEFSRSHAGRIGDFADYLALEERLFAQLDEQVYAAVSEERRNPISRYSPGSRMDPRGFPRDWNRSFELIPREQPVGGVLLLHGLSDSPYSLRSIGERLHAQGYRVLGLRLPGHGTAPSGLLDVTWQDWAEAVRLAARHLAAQLEPGRPLHLIGFSTGAALAVDYGLSVVEGEPLPRPARLVLLSPAIGVSEVAALAIWQERLSQLAGLEKLAWNSIEPEFDPFKYNSFSVNAGDQIYQLTRNISTRLEGLAGSTGITGFPRLLAFLSVVDATISTSALVDVLFARLAPEGHELVLFDVNRRAEAETLLSRDPEALLERLISDPGLPCDLSLVTNADPGTGSVVVRQRRARSHEQSVERLDLAWPIGAFSLSHVALPFPPDDPVYGATPDEDPTHPWITLGSVFIRGERGLLLFPDDYFMRLRHNPFHPYLLARVETFLEEGSAPP